MTHADIISLSDAELQALITSPERDGELRRDADSLRREHNGDSVYLRGLIEFTNYCRNNCHYCGIRAGNVSADRYRLTKNDILDCCRTGRELGFRTFVLQGGEDMYYSDSDIADIVECIKSNHPDCAVTLSIGERERGTYALWKRAGADRYLLRQEAASAELYSSLHPESMSLEHRKRCLFELRELGYQVGTGFMVGAPGQTAAHIVEDIRFMQSLSPQMIGIGPFLPHAQTVYASNSGGSVKLTLRLISVLRLFFPKALIPATTALGTAHQQGREMGLKAGANVVMPNLSPVGVRKKYDLYDDKICTGEEAAECKVCLARRVEAAGYRIEESRGDALDG